MILTYFVGIMVLCLPEQQLLKSCSSFLSNIIVQSVDCGHSQIIESTGEALMMRMLLCIGNYWNWNKKFNLRIKYRIKFITALMNVFKHNSCTEWKKLVTSYLQIFNLKRWRDLMQLMLSFYLCGKNFNVGNFTRGLYFRSWSWNGNILILFWQKSTCYIESG